MSEFSREFALQGADPAFHEQIHVGRPNQPSREAFFRRVNEALDRNWLSNNGPLVQEFEAAICEITGAAHCIAVSNGTAGLQVAMRATGIGGPVATPSFTFVATAAAAVWLDIEPALVDIESERFGVCPDEVRRLPSVDGIVGVHVWGIPCAITDLTEIARRRDCPLVFDAAHALGSSVEGRPVGGFGTAEVFSFHATKLIHSFEGGAITTNDEGLADELRRMINFGFVGYDDVRHIGTNAKMSEINAAMGLAMVDHLPVILDRNASNRHTYEEAMSAIPGIDFVSPPIGTRTNDQYVVAMVDTDQFGLSRDQLYDTLHSENVLARRYFSPGVHRMPPYEKFAGDRSFPTTDAVSAACLAFPTGLAMNGAAVRRIASLVERIHERSHTVAQLLANRDSL